MDAVVGLVRLGPSGISRIPPECDALPGAFVDVLAAHRGPFLSGSPWARALLNGAHWVVPSLPSCNLAYHRPGIRMPAREDVVEEVFSALVEREVAPLRENLATAASGIARMAASDEARARPLAHAATLVTRALAALPTSAAPGSPRLLAIDHARCRWAATQACGLIPDVLTFDGYWHAWGVRTHRALTLAVASALTLLEADYTPMASIHA